MDKTLRSMNLKELDEYRKESVQDAALFYPICEYIVEKLGQDVPDSLYRAKSWKNDLVTIIVVLVDNTFSTKQQKFIETKRVVVKYAGTTAVNVLFKDGNIMDEPDHSRAIPGKWQGVVQDVFNQAVASEQIETARIEKARRNHLISILEQEV